MDIGKAIDKQRDDRDAILAVTSFMANHAERQGVTRGDVDAHMGTSDMGGWWLSRLRHRCQCPQVAQYAALKTLLSLPDDMDAEVWRLNGRKGTPGEAWEQREVIGSASLPVGHAFAGPTYGGDSSSKAVDITAPATDAARRWDGWGTALKPASEPIAVARKPLIGTVVANVAAHGVGGLNIDGCRVNPGASVPGGGGLVGGAASRHEGWQRPSHLDGAATEAHTAGRWPANAVFTHAQSADGGDACADGCVEGCPVRELDEQSGKSDSKSGGHTTNALGIMNDDAWHARKLPRTGHDDSGGASRFFPTFRHPRECALHGMLMGCERSLSESSTTHASTAESASPITPGTIAGTVPVDARTSPAEQNALRVASAANLCGSCATAIARSVAATPPGHSRTQQLGLPSTDDYSERILNHSLALVAEDLAKPGTTSTTADWMTSLGCARDAISTYTARANLGMPGKSARSSQDRMAADWPVAIYQAKAPTKERPKVDGVAHPTTKPLKLMQFLVRLVTPPGGICLDPFVGSGTTIEAALLEGFDVIGIESDASYLPLIQVRIDRV